MLTPSERSLRGQIAAHSSWAHTENRSARTAPARQAMLGKFEQQVDPDGVLTPAERALRAENARKAYFSRLALKSAQSRRRAKEARDEANLLDQAADDADQALRDFTGSHHRGGAK